jgi:hypothetical protein
MNGENTKRIFLHSKWRMLCKKLSENISIRVCTYVCTVHNLWWKIAWQVATSASKLVERLLLSLIFISFMLNRVSDTFASHRRIRKSFLKGQQDKIGTVGFWYFINTYSTVQGIWRDSVIAL